MDYTAGGMRWALGVWGLALVCMGALAMPAIGEDGPALVDRVPPPGHPRPYMRIDRPNEQAVGLEIAARRFTAARDAAGRPTIWLVGVTHVGDPAYYASLQAMLDGQALVLFEGVGRPDFAETGEADAATRRRRTLSGLKFLAAQIAWYHQRTGAMPRTLGLLKQAVRTEQPKATMWLRHAATDGWANAVVYERDGDAFTLTSYAADGQPGGAGAAADLVVDQATELSDAVKLPDSTLQGDLARALGLVFQLDAINYDRAHFVNSDLSMEGMRGRLAADPDAEPDEQFNEMMRLMDGTSMMSGVVKVGLKLIESSPQIRMMVKLMLVEMLGSIEGDLAKMPGLPPGMQRLMKTLIEDRNRIVIDDLRRALAGEDPPATIAVFYGAGHMHDLERRLYVDLQYRPVETKWFAAFTANGEEAGLTAAEMQMIRAMVKSQLDQLRGE